jgi:hypothetical protein
MKRFILALCLGAIVVSQTGDAQTERADIAPKSLSCQEELEALRVYLSVSTEARLRAEQQAVMFQHLLNKLREKEKQQ